MIDAINFWIVMLWITIWIVFGIGKTGKTMRKNRRGRQVRRGNARMH